jgi:hypothetical protein
MASDRYPDGFAWSQNVRRYRNKATGRFVAQATIQRLRDEFVDGQYGFLEDLTAGLADGTRTLRSWEAELWDRIKIAFNAEFLAGRGGRNALTSADRTAIARMLKEQRAYLRRFVEEIANGTFTEAAINTRGKMYLNASRHAFERGKARSWGLRLPAYPADGSTECLTNDRCYWDITEKPDRYNCYWRLSVAEHCSTCLDRAGQWTPYVVYK